MRNVTYMTGFRCLGRQLLLASLGFGLCTGLSAEEFESADTIEQLAESFALSRINGAGLKDIEARASALDARLRLKKCDQPLEAFTTGSNGIQARTTIGVRCSGASPWTLYVPVAVEAMSPVVFTTRPLLRGERIPREALELRYMPLQRLPRRAVSDPDQVVGMEANRAVAAETPLAVSSLQTAKLIERGQEVIILAQGAGIAVRMAGSALKSGSKDEVIPIKNLSSGKTLEARIVSESTVLVGF